MSHKIKLQYVRDKIPICYRHKPWLRWFMIAISLAIMIYSIYFMMQYVTSETPIFFKILPIAIGFVGLDSILKKATALNSVTFESSHLRLGFIAKKPIQIAYKDVLALELYRKITFYFSIRYLDDKGREKSYVTNASFPNILEIILNIADLAPQATIPEKMQGILDYLKASATDELQSSN